MYRMLTTKLKLVSLFGIRAMNATFFWTKDWKSSSSVAVKDARLYRLNFSSLAASVIWMIFSVFAEPEW